MSEKLNVYQKLSEVRELVPYLKKEKEGKQFSYVGSSDVLGALHGKINEMGLILVPSIVGHKVTVGATNSGTTNYFTELDMVMTWINVDDPKDNLECQWYAQGMDLAGEKGVGKALTYGEKYFLLKFFNIATDKDDPDSFQDRVESKQPPKKIDVTKQTIVRGKLEEFANMQGIDVETVTQQLFSYLKINRTVSALTEEDFGRLMNYLNGKLSVNQNKEPRPEQEKPQGRAWDKGKGE